MKKLLFFINSLGYGGAERVLVDLVNQIDKSKFKITVQTVIDDESKKSELSNEVSYKTIISTKIKCLRYIFIFAISKILPARLTYIFFVKGNYDIEIAFLEGLPTKIIAASNNMKSKKIAWVHTDFMKSFESSKLFSSIDSYKKTYLKYNRIFFVSNDAKKQFKKRFKWQKNNLYTIYNVNNCERINLLSKEYTIPMFNTKEINFVTCGRLVHQKGYERLLRIHKRLIDEGYKFKLWIVGDGPEYKKLDNIIQNNSISDSVSLVGYRDNPYPFIANADVFVCSSLLEGYSTVVTEAVILGTPIISTKVAGSSEPRECLRYSILCNNDEESLYKTMKSVLDHPEMLDELREKMKSKRRYFNSKNQIQVIEERFNECLDF